MNPIAAVSPNPPSTAGLLYAFLTLPPYSKPALLDLRTATEYTHSHIPYSTNIPLAHLASRLHELPAPPCALLLHPPSAFSAVLSLLRTRGYILHILPSTDTPRTAGPSSRALWSPSPLLRAAIPLLLRLRTRSALDIGCGSGRDAKYLAMHSFLVTAVDRDAHLLSKASVLHAADYYHPDCPASPGGLHTIQRTFGADRCDDIAFLRRHAAMVLLVVRFLRRGVLEHLPEGVLPGGYVLYEHFLDGCENFGGPMKKSQMLRHGELAGVFSKAKHFQVIRDDVSTLPDGRPIARFIARREL